MRQPGRSRFTRWTCSLACLATCLTASTASALSPPTVSNPGISTITDEARLYVDVGFSGSPQGTGHQQDCMTTALGYHFATYFNENDEVCLARRAVGGGAWKEVVFPASTLEIEDTHRTPNVAVSLNDGRIHLTFDQQGSRLRYIISSAGAATETDTNFTSALFSGERNYLKSGEPILRVTYPRFVTLKQSNTLVLFWNRRDAGAGHSHLNAAKYNDDGTWTSVWQVTAGNVGTYVDPTNQNAPSTQRWFYANDIAAHGEEIHLTGCWRENPFGWRNHDLVYAKSVDFGQTWTNTLSDTIGTTSSPLNVESTGFVVEQINYDALLINQMACDVDSQGNTHVVLRHKVDNGTGPLRLVHYVRQGTSWTSRELPHSPTLNAGRPKIYIDRAQHTINGFTFHPDTAYVTTVQGEKLHIFASQRFTLTEEETVDSNWNGWELRYFSWLSNFSNEMNGRLSADGLKLTLLAQRPGELPESEISQLDVLEFPLNPNP